MARRPRAVSPDEVELFHETVKDAKPLAGRKRKPRIAPPPTLPPAQPQVRASTPAPAVRPIAVPTPKPAPPRPSLAALDHGVATGIDKRTLERFRKGEMPVDANLDLHGMTQDAAHVALLRFVDRAAAAGHRCLLIVTGKGLREGTGVLRKQVPRWLNDSLTRPKLLAIHRARPQHGGDGALYVLLKRKR
jgi:DNA-nicking Smr family endonuclease